MNMDTTQQTEMAEISRNGNNSAAASRINGHIIPCSVTASQSAAARLGEYINRPNYKKVVIRYKECLKNHAAAIGGLAIDGCGEFMPGDNEGSLEALKCSACNCHRNFHRKEIDQSDYTNSSLLNFNNLKKPIWGDSNNNNNNNNNNNVTSSSSQLAYPASTHSTFVVSYKNGSVPNLETHDYNEQIKIDEETYNGGNFQIMGSRQQVHEKVRKRFRTKFTQEQKEKLLSFAEKADWKIQKLDESVIQQFCQEIGIKRRILKVWMHNNKQNYANNKSTPSITTTALVSDHHDSP